jgi:hypothetical protein
MPERYFGIGLEEGPVEQLYAAAPNTVKPEPGSPPPYLYTAGAVHGGAWF